LIDEWKSGCFQFVCWCYCQCTRPSHNTQQRPFKGFGRPTKAKTGTQINLVRANIVYHELRENYYRVNGSSYQVAHEQAMLDYSGVRLTRAQEVRAIINNSPRISDAIMLRSAANTTSNSNLIYIRR
jgi:hypothetical protein